MKSLALAWSGIDAPRFEVAFVELHEDRLMARGTQVGAAPQPSRLRYELTTTTGFVTEHLHVEAEPGSDPFTIRSVDIDLGFSPLFNTLPILRHRLDLGGAGRDITVAKIDVPSLAVETLVQRYEHVRPHVVRYREGDYSAELELDADGFVRHYPGLARREPAGR